MKQYRCVPEKELLEILEAANKYWAIENGGVDNWDWYCDSLHDYLENWIAESGVDPSGDWDFESIAEYDSYNYLSTEF